MTTATPSGYHLRAASLADVATLVHHRLAMFREMGLATDDRVSGAFTVWLHAHMANSTYRAWVVESLDRTIVALRFVTARRALVHRSDRYLAVGMNGRSMEP